MNLFDMIAEDEEKALAETRTQIAAEKAAYDALPQEEKDRLAAEAAARWDALGASDDEIADEEDDEGFEDYEGYPDEEDE
jgi:hypothetical protein